MPLRKATVSLPRGDRTLDQVSAPLDLDALVPGGDGPGGGGWEVEIGFGKGRYLLDRCQAEAGRRFLGIEIAGKYHGILVERARKRGLENFLALRGEAAYLMSAVLPAGFARAVHVYFPDPWPKARHHKRRLFDPENLDLLLGLLAPGGRLWFATDFLDYGELVVELLGRMPGLEIEPHPEPWPDGARTNYEAKYMEEGRPILRLTASFRPGADPGALHPDGALGILSAWAPKEDPAEE